MTGQRYSFDDAALAGQNIFKTSLNYIKIISKSDLSLKFGI